MSERKEDLQEYGKVWSDPERPLQLVQYY